MFASHVETILDSNTSGCINLSVKITYLFPTTTSYFWWFCSSCHSRLL